MQYIKTMKLYYYDRWSAVRPYNPCGFVTDNYVKALASAWAVKREISRLARISKELARAYICFS